MLNLAGDLDNSLANGPGMRYVLFTQGCSHNPHCKGCQNQHTWNKDTICRLISVDDELEIIKNNMPIISGVTFSGGEPFDQAAELSELAVKCHKLKLNVMCYSGFTYEELLNKAALYEPGISSLLENIDILVDGRFEIDNQEGKGSYRGSKNQRMIYLKDGKIVSIK